MLLGISGDICHCLLGTTESSQSNSLLLCYFAAKLLTVFQFLSCLNWSGLFTCSNELFLFSSFCTGLFRCSNTKKRKDINRFMDKKISSLDENVK